MSDNDIDTPRTKRTPEDLRRMLHDADIRLRDKKADKKSAIKAYREDIDGIEEEISDILKQLEGSK